MKFKEVIEMRQKRRKRGIIMVAF